MIDKAQLLADLKAARKLGLLPMVVRIGKGDESTIDATADTGEQYTVWARTEDNGDPLVVYFTPGKVPYAWLVYNAEMEVERNDRNQLEIQRPYTGLRDALAGAPLPTNAYDWIHTHESDAEAGQLNASLIFDEGAVQAIYGGTGQSVYAVGDLLYASTTTALSKLADVATGNALISGGVGVAPTWGKIALTTHVSGTLPVANGGTGAATLTANNVLLGDGTNPLQVVAPGTSGNVLTSNGTTWQSTAPAASGGWTDDGTVVRLTTSTDSVSIGTATANGKLYVLGDDAAEVTVRIRAAAAQSADTLSIEDNSGNVWFAVDSGGQVSVNPGEASTGDFIANGVGTTLIFTDASANTVFIDGTFVFNQLGSNIDARFAGDNDANLLFLDASTDRVGIGDSTPDGRFAVVGRADEVQTIIRGNATQTSNTLEIQNSAATVVASVTNAGQINGVQLGLTSAVASTTTPNILIRDTAQNFGHAKGSGSTGLYVSLDGMYSARGSDVTVTSKTAPGTLIGVITVPADFFRVGRQIRFKFSGRGETANLDNVLRLVVQDGSTDLIDTRTSTSSTTGVVRDIEGEVLITCRSVGATGTVWVSARVFSSLFTDGGGSRDPNTAADTIDTTGTRTFNIRLYWAGTGTNPPTITVSDDYFDIAG